MQTSRVASEVARVVSLAVYSALDGSLPLLTHSAPEAAQYLQPRATRLGVSSMLRCVRSPNRLRILFEFYYFRTCIQYTNTDYTQPLKYKIWNVLYYIISRLQAHTIGTIVESRVCVHVCRRVLPGGFRLESGPKRTVCSMHDIVEFLETCASGPVAASSSSTSDLGANSPNYNLKPLLAAAENSASASTSLSKCPIPVSLLQALFVDAIAYSKYSHAAKLIRVLQSTRLVLDCEIRVPLPTAESTATTAAAAQELMGLGIGAATGITPGGSCVCVCVCVCLS